MPVYRAELVAQPKHFKVMCRATIVYEAENQSDAEDQAQAYADRLGAYDTLEIDTVQEIGETAK